MTDKHDGFRGVLVMLERVLSQRIDAHVNEACARELYATDTLKSAPKSRKAQKEAEEGRARGWNLRMAAKEADEIRKLVREALDWNPMTGTPR